MNQINCFPKFQKCGGGKFLEGLFGSRVLKGRGGEIFNLKCLVQFLRRGEEGSTAKIILRLI